MPKRIPVNSVFVQRDGKQIRCPIGEEFEFTAAEIDDIMRASPTAIRKVLVEDKELAKQLAQEEKEKADAAEVARKEAVAAQEKAAKEAAAAAKAKKTGATSAADL